MTKLGNPELGSRSLKLIKMGGPGRRREQSGHHLPPFEGHTRFIAERASKRHTTIGMMGTTAGAAYTVVGQERRLARFPFYIVSSPASVHNRALF